MAYDGATTRGLNFLGLEFSDADLETTTDAIAVRASLDLPFAYVATPNVDHVVGLANDPSRQPLYDAAWLRLNDSRVLRGLAKRAGMNLPTVTGADVAEHLLDTVIDRNEPITIIGGSAESIAALKHRYRLTDVRWHEPPMNLVEKPGAIVDAAQFAAAQNARFTFICVGAPQQEMVAYTIQQLGRATGVGLCVGAALDFLSGRAERAPVWMRRAGLEWLHRLASEPKRMWKRYLVDGPKVFSLFAAWRAASASASAA